MVKYFGFTFINRDNSMFKSIFSRDFILNGLLSINLEYKEASYFVLIWL